MDIIRPPADDPAEVEVPPTLRFPVERTAPTDGEAPTDSDPAEADRLAEEALAAVESMSRRIEDLARELNCLGFFDGDDDGPRAA